MTEELKNAIEVLENIRVRARMAEEVVFPQEYLRKTLLPAIEVIVKYVKGEIKNDSVEKVYRMATGT